MDFGRPYTAAGSGNEFDGGLQSKLHAASLLAEEPDTGFSLAMPGQSINDFGAGGRLNSGGVSNPGGYVARSNYTGSDFGESETHSQSRPRQQQASANFNAGGYEIGSMEMTSGSRRSGRFAGPPPQNRPQTGVGGGGRMFSSGGDGDILDKEIGSNANPLMNRGRSTAGLLSDVGSQYG